MNRFVDFPYENREKYHSDVHGGLIDLAGVPDIQSGLPERAVTQPIERVDLLLTL